MHRLLPLAVLLALAACSSDPPPKTTRSVSAERASEATPEPPAEPAAAEPVAPAPVEPVQQREPVDLQAAIYNRVLARADGPVDVEELKAAIAKATGAEVEHIRKGALGLLSIRFAPTDPPRDAEAQKKLVQAVQGMNRLRSVEAEKLMKAMK
jgi:hypothetical protein